MELMNGVEIVTGERHLDRAAGLAAGREDGRQARKRKLRQRGQRQTETHQRDADSNWSV